MYKKALKYLKTILLFIVILSMTAPSFAALSASDGSAFVTKAEFDAALTDFNSRLTTFEAGINSKIDSQVTSYLDKNGIWNGAKQTFVGSDLSNYNTNWYIKDYSVNTEMATMEWDTSTTMAGGPIVLKESAPVVIINEINKSGLCFLPINMAIGNTQDIARDRLVGGSSVCTDGTMLSRTCYIDNNTTRSFTVSSAYAAYISYTLLFGLNSNKDKSFSDGTFRKKKFDSFVEVIGSQNASNSNWKPSATQGTSARMCIQLSFVDIVNDNMFFFVSKGQQLVMKYEVSFVGQSSYVGYLFRGAQGELNAENAINTVTAKGFMTYGWKNAIVY